MKLNRVNVIVTVLSLGSIAVALGYTAAQLPPPANKKAPLLNSLSKLSLLARLYHYCRKWALLWLMAKNIKQK